MPKAWTAIVLTSENKECAYAFFRELKFRKEKGQIDASTLILSVEDPQEGVGSGGATMNALLVVAEHLSALQGFTVVTSEVIKDARILILHMGSSFLYSACRQAFLTLPATVDNVNGVSSSSHLICNIDLILHNIIGILAADSPPGVWICSTDRLVMIPQDTRISWDHCHSICLFVTSENVAKVEKAHGVCKLNDKHIVEDIIYKGDKEEINHCKIGPDVYPTISGIVYLNSHVAETLLSFHVMAPLDACTYLGIDNGARVIKNLSLFFDVLLASAKDVSQEDFVAGRRSGVYGTKLKPELDNIDKVFRKEARRLIWRSMSEFHMKAVVLKDSQFHYISHFPHEVYSAIINNPYKSVKGTNLKFMNQFHVYKRSINPESDESNYIAVNAFIDGAVIGDDTVIVNSVLKGNMNIGRGCFLSNLRPKDYEDFQEVINIPDDLLFHAFHVRLGFAENNKTQETRRVPIVIGLKDDPHLAMDDPSSTFCNKPWSEFFERTGISPSELWCSVKDGNTKCLLNARLFPIFNSTSCIGLKDLLWLQGSTDNPTMLAKWRSSWCLSYIELLKLSDTKEEFDSRRNLYFKIGCKHVRHVLTNKTDDCILPLLRTCCIEGHDDDILKTLDRVASSADDPVVISRTLACIADVLGVKAQGRGGLRSGPAANKSFKQGLGYLVAGRVSDAVEDLASARQKWLSRPDLLVRAARHYEGAFQILVRNSVASGRQFINLKKIKRTEINQWVIADAPARMDLAGTWTDTPPICYEHGGIVSGLAVNIDHQKPIYAKARLIPKYHIVLILGKDDDVIRIECNTLTDLLNYSQPNSPGALLKASFFCADILSTNSPLSLQDQLKNYGGGFELHTWTILPHGSGLGTSSILAGAVLGALWRVVGFEQNNDAIIHAVLDLEQMLTTGGGWQDQVGGLFPGAKYGSSEKGLPLKVCVTPIKVPDGFYTVLEQHVVVIFTGKTRLAKNLLQDVLRNWNARLPSIVSTADDLILNAKASIKAIENGDIAALGKCLSLCWVHKKAMAPGCEPPVVRALMDAIAPHAHGQCLAGAGGGGFMFVITKTADCVAELKNVVDTVQEARGKATVHKVSINQEGLSVGIM